MRVQNSQLSERKIRVTTALFAIGEDITTPLPGESVPVGLGTNTTEEVTLSVEEGDPLPVEGVEEVDDGDPDPTD